MLPEAGGVGRQAYLDANQVLQVKVYWAVVDIRRSRSGSGIEHLGLDLYNECRLFRCVKPPSQLHTNFWT